ncbi:MAG: chromosome partitioning protein ParB [Sphingomonadales bacterium]|nr:chromosome partitioning protein ParB [Sphingomonadales bacterium]
MTQPKNDNVTPFQVDLKKLRSTRKLQSEKELSQMEERAAKKGFNSRESSGTPGRKPSPRTGQVHAKVLPNVSDEIKEEKNRRGVVQGVLIEEAWALYKREHGL